VPRNDLIQLRSDTAANWASVNPTLAVGEQGFETDTGKLKVGTGSTAWSSLLYVTDASDLAGVIPSARISGSYTGITGVGTLTGLTVDGVSSSALTFGDWSTTATHSGIEGNMGYLLLGKNALDNFNVYLRSNNSVGGVYIGANNTNILNVNVNGINVTGTITASSNIGWSASNYLTPVTGASTNYGSVKVTGTPTSSGWAGYSINGDAVFMSQSIWFGLYDNTNLKWGILCARNGQTDIHYDGASKIQTTTTGANTTGTHTATTFTGALASSNLTGQTGMWTSAGRPGASRLYRNDYDDAYNVQTYYNNTNSRWRLYGYFNNTAHAGVEVAYSDSSGVASGVSSGGGGIPYPGATIGGGAPNSIGFRWANPVVNCTVDNVISAEAANFSDRRLKTNITSYFGGLDAARNLRPVTFNPLDIVSFTDDGEPIIGDNNPYDEMVGFIADEVQGVIPSAISGTGNQLKSVSVLQVLSVAVSAIKELDATVQSLTERIKQLEESNV